ncbi:protein of unassigned function [Methylobacterium oryzae CBMB20]|uniref:Protein of unassigned function n=1 Tax=Methylobacterium oryzae CBMB20 TaxID=693986 RepID=A0A089NVM4_9HYPH|nr:protein of unassigned function [Methylobacterium oryzae CBMB20]
MGIGVGQPRCAHQCTSDATRRRSLTHTLIDRNVGFRGTLTLSGNDWTGR